MKVLATCISEKKGTMKTEVEELFCIQDCGIKNDAHAGTYREVSIMAMCDLLEYQKDYPPFPYGAYGENILIDGPSLAKLELGTCLEIGDVILELIQIGKRCHDACVIRKLTGDCVMPKIGAFFKVKKGGIIKKGDSVKILDSDPKYLKSVKEDGLVSGRRLVIVGVGALGQIVAEQLVRLGFKDFVFIDNDVIHKENFNRQLYADADSLYRPKVEIAKKRLLRIFADLRIVTYPEKFKRDHFKVGDIIFDCLDDPGARIDLEKIAALNGSPLIHGAVEKYFGQVGFIKANDVLIADLYRKEEKRAIEVLMPSVVMAGSLMVNEFLMYLKDQERKTELLVFDLLKTKLEKVR